MRNTKASTLLPHLVVGAMMVAVGCGGGEVWSPDLGPTPNPPYPGAYIDGSVTSPQPSSPQPSSPQADPDPYGASGGDDPLPYPGVSFDPPSAEGTPYIDCENACSDKTYDDCPDVGPCYPYIECVEADCYPLLPECQPYHKRTCSQMGSGYEQECSCPVGPQCDSQSKCDSESTCIGGVCIYTEDCHWADCMPLYGAYDAGP